MAEILRIDGTSTPVEPENGKTFQLAELQGIVGGFSEILHLRDGRLMILNKEGKLQGLRYNRIATSLTGGSILSYDYIVGDCLVCHREQIVGSSSAGNPGPVRDFCTQIGLEKSMINVRRLGCHSSSNSGENGLL